ncbi:MAG: extracellular solute-binding protein [Spirochaetales bacterium]|nr:extracellular solute-binding protein [Spirochaetales bacterium]
MKKFMSVLIVLMLISTSVFAAGQQDAASSDGREKIVIHIHNFLNDKSVTGGLEEIQKMEKFSHVDFVIKDKDEEYETTLPIAVAGGEQIDVVAVFNPIQQNKMAKAGVIQPLDKYIAELGVDMNKEFGGYANNAKFEGKTVMFPHQVTKWVLYYNKKVFDDAGVAYPDPEVPMTWTEYAEVAAAITQGEGGNKVYGALHLDWPMFWYGEAIMKLGGGEKFYNAQGLSNIEDPIFAKALERTFNMQHVDKSIPTHADIIMSKTGPQAFMNGQYGMIVQGAWLLSWAADKATYPRDWELGIAPMPVDAGTTQKTWGIVNGYAVAQTSKNPQLAAEVALELSRLDSEYTETAPAANQTYGQENLYVGSGEKLGGEGLTVQVIQRAFNYPGSIFVTEKVTGPNNVEYETIINEEVEKYLVQEQDLATTIANIKTRGDKAITK